MLFAPFIINFFMINPVFGAGNLLEVRFEKAPNFVHEYKIKKAAKSKKGYILSFINEKRQVRDTVISEDEFQGIMYKATEIFWENAYRKPAAIKNCQKYMELKMHNESTTICHQNVTTTGMSYGFLNLLHRMIHK